MDLRLSSAGGGASENLHRHEKVGLRQKLIRIRIKLPSIIAGQRVRNDPAAPLAELCSWLRSARRDCVPFLMLYNLGLSKRSTSPMTQGTRNSEVRGMKHKQCAAHRAPEWRGNSIVREIGGLDNTAGAEFSCGKKHTPRRRSHFCYATPKPPSMDAPSKSSFFMAWISLAFAK